MRMSPTSSGEGGTSPEQTEHSEPTNFCSNEVKVLIVHLYHHYFETRNEDNGEDEDSEDEDQNAQQQTRDGKRAPMSHDKQLRIAHINKTLTKKYKLRGYDRQKALYYNALKLGVCEKAKNDDEMYSVMHYLNSIFVRQRTIAEHEERLKTWVMGSYKTRIKPTRYSHMEEMVVTFLRKFVAPSVSYNVELAQGLTLYCMDLLGEEHKTAYMVEEAPSDYWQKRAFRAGSYNYRMESDERDPKDEMAAVDCLDDTWRTLKDFPKDRIFSARNLEMTMRAGSTFNAWMCCNGDGSVKLAPWVPLQSVFSEFDQTLQDYYNPDLTEEEKMKLELAVEKETEKLKQKFWACNSRADEALLDADELEEQLEEVSLGSAQGKKLQKQLDEQNKIHNTLSTAAIRASEAYERAKKRIYHRHGIETFTNAE